MVMSEENFYRTGPGGSLILSEQLQNLTSIQLVVFEAVHRYRGDFLVEVIESKGVCNVKLSFYAITLDEAGCHSSLRVSK